MKARLAGLGRIELARPGLTRSGLTALAALNLLPTSWAVAQSPSPPPVRALAETALPASYGTALASSGVADRSAAVVIRPLDGGPINVSRNASVAMSPASTMKLATTYAALLRLGPDFTWTTEALASGAFADGVLNGALAIRGRGDPTLVVEKLWLLVHRIRSAGIRELRGELLLDRSYFEPIPHDPEEFDGAESRAYNAGPDALLVNFKALTYEFVPDAAAGVARIVATPPVAPARIPASVRGVAGPCGDWRSRLRGDISDPLAPRFAGEYPLACGTRAWHVNALEPTPYFAAVFRALWERSGGSWNVTRVRDATVPPDARLVASHESRPLIDVVRDINKFSNNVMTRQLLLTMGAVASGRSATLASGVAAVRDALARRGLPTGDLVLENGSGLSRIEKLPPATLAALLEDAWRSPHMSELMSSLPIAGTDGTLRTRTAAAGRAHLKTGMLANVRSIAGYVQAASGRRYVLVAIINDPRARSAQAAHDALLEWLVRVG